MKRTKTEKLLIIQFKLLFYTQGCRKVTATKFYVDHQVRSISIFMPIECLSQWHLCVCTSNAIFFAEIYICHGIHIFRMSSIYLNDFFSFFLFFISLISFNSRETPQFIKCDDQAKKRVEKIYLSKTGRVFLLLSFSLWLLIISAKNNE